MSLSTGAERATSQESVDGETNLTNEPAELEELEKAKKRLFDWIPRQGAKFFGLNENASTYLLNLITNAGSEKELAYLEAWLFRRSIGDREGDKSAQKAIEEADQKMRSAAEDLGLDRARQIDNLLNDF